MQSILYVQETFFFCCLTYLLFLIDASVNMCNITPIVVLPGTLSKFLIKIHNQYAIINKINYSRNLIYLLPIDTTSFVYGKTVKILQNIEQL